MKPSKIFPALVFLAMLMACAAPSSSEADAEPQPVTGIPAVTLAPTIAVPLEATATFTPAPLPLPQGMPTVETNFDAMLAALQSGEAGYFEAFAAEKYSDKDFAQPGTLIYTAAIPATQKIYFNYSWCAANKETLKQNLEHIELKMYFNGQEIPHEYIQSLSSVEDNGWECAYGGMLLSGWQPGSYGFRIVAAFDEKINDGSSDYEAGDYIQEYTITVQ